MGRLGVLVLLSLGATLLFAIPIGAFGVELLIEGQTALGVAGILVAVGLVVTERVLWTPEDVLGDVLQGVVGTIVGRPPDEKQR